MKGEQSRSLVLAVRERLSVRAATVLLLLGLLGYGIATWPLEVAAIAVVGGILALLVLLRPELGIAAIAFAVPFGSLKQIHLGSFAFGATEVLLGLVLASWLVRMLIAGRLLFGRAPLLPQLLGFLCATLLSLLSTASISSSAVEIAKWLELLAVYLFVATCLDQKATRVLLLALISSGILQALLGIYQFVLQVGPPEFVLFGRFMRASGTFAQPNPYGGYLGLTLPIAVGVTMARGSVCRRTESGGFPNPATVRMVGAVGTLLMGLALVMSWSRGAWLGLAGALLIMGLARGLRWLSRVLLIGLVVLALLAAMDLLHLLPTSVFRRVGDLGIYLRGIDLSSVEVTDDNWAVIERLAHWQAAIRMLDEHPWTGVGIGNYALAYPHYAVGRWEDPLGHAHNFYLHVGAETGLVGMLSYVVLVVAWLWQAWRTVHQTQGYWQAVALGALGVLTHLSVHNLFDNLYVHGMYLQVGIVSGLLCVAGRYGRHDAERTAPI